MKHTTSWSNNGPRPDARLNATTARLRVSGFLASSARCKIPLHCASVAAKLLAAKAAAIETIKTPRILLRLPDNYD